MSLKTILVSLNDTSRANEILSAVTLIASANDAHVIGVFVIPAMQVYPSIGATVTSDMYEFHNKHYADRAATAKRVFEDEMRKQDIRYEWRELTGTSSFSADSFVVHAMLADLVIISQMNEDSTSGLESDFAERVVMESGRPVLIIPNHGSFPKIGDNVLVGWNATRESARATFDALPLIRNAKKVQISWVNPARDAWQAGDLPGSEISSTLARHAIAVNDEPLPTDGLAAGEALLSAASDLGADLLVMGAYGHTRMREFIFGGATRTVMQSMTLPVLMSH